MWGILCVRETMYPCAVTRKLLSVKYICICVQRLIRMRIKFAFIVVTYTTNRTNYAKNRVSPRMVSYQTFK